MSAPSDALPALMPSLLDRLLDPHSMGTSGRPGYGLQQMIDSVRADLEDLLNTRCPTRAVPRAFPEVQNSIVTYGLPDFASLSAATLGEREDIGRVIEELIARFEPRLRQIRATIVEVDDGDDRHVRFHIDARLCVDPSPEVAFDTILELTTGQASIQSSAV